ncbi:hypothetical protein AX14_011228 [Amanita brunnescens Koide BX004]|nr:hypothetical protein AX14_011228 [Amanita brunnescens Koide BX004]
MPPKKVSFKAPVASSLTSNPIAPSDNPADRLRSLLASSASRSGGPAPSSLPAPEPVLRTAPSAPSLAAPPSQTDIIASHHSTVKPASAGTPHDVASLKTDLVNLQEKYDFLMEAYEHKRADFRALTIDHSALQRQFESLTAKLEQVSGQLTISASEPTRPPTKDLASCAVQTDLVPTSATAPEPPLKKTYAKAAKASATMPPVTPDKALSSIPTQPFTPDSAPSNHAPGPFRGRRATKPNELHVQLHSRAAFNSALLKYSSLKLNHRHALLDAFVNAPPSGRLAAT